MLKLLARIWFFDKFKLRIIIKNRTTYSKKYRLNFWYKYTTKPIWILFQHGEPLLLEQLLNKTVILYTQCAVKLRFYLVVPYVTVQYFSPTYRKLFAIIYLNFCLHQHTVCYILFFTNITTVEIFAKWKLWHECKIFKTADKDIPRLGKIADTDMTNFEIADTDTDMKVFEIADTDADTDMQVFETADTDTDMNFLKNRDTDTGRTSRGHACPPISGLDILLPNVFRYIDDGFLWPTSFWCFNPLFKALDKESNVFMHKISWITKLHSTNNVCMHEKNYREFLLPSKAFIYNWFFHWRFKFSE